MKKSVATSLVAVIMIGCGSGSSSSDSTTTATPTTITGQFVDSPVEGIIYKSSSYSGVTDENGNYQCKNGEAVSFYAGGVKLGEILCSNLTTPNSLAHGYESVAQNIAYFLQNLDSDGNISNGIQLPDDIPTMAVDFTDETSVNTALNNLGISEPKITPEKAYQNFKTYMMSIKNGSYQTNPTDLNLTDEQKYAIAYMWNDEKMAHDLYLALYDIFPNKTLYNIATKAETTHKSIVENLAKTYDINITNYQNGYGEHYSQEDLDKYGAGEFFIPAVQQTYDTLYNQGSKSEIDALKVGCMVEVVDVDDLDKYLDVVKDKPDITSAFENLRSGSYNHYWAFDTALKNLGVSNGCCSLGDEYCKTPEEFPSNNGNENKGKGNGNGYQGGK